MKSDSIKPLLWLREEVKPGERRTPVTPITARALLDAGFKLKVERSNQRVFADDQYQAAGAELVSPGSWREAPVDAVILGLKELSASSGPFTHSHVHFAHVFKQQKGWRDTLLAFAEGGGTLLDLEYLVDETGRRVAAFGYWAGYVGAALALLTYAGQRDQAVNQTSVDESAPLKALQSWSSRAQLLDTVKAALATVAAMPRVLVIGAKGRSGQGAMALCHEAGARTTAWDQAETRDGGPFDAALAHEVLISCVFVDAPLPPFTTLENLAEPQRMLQVIADVGCDPNGPFNPLPLYTSCTSLDQPVLNLNSRIGTGHPPLDLIAIDHLPTLLPVESSEDFAEQLLPCLLSLDMTGEGPWQRAATRFQLALDEARSSSV